MAKKADVRKTILIECKSCRSNNERGVSRYSTYKNKRNTPSKIVLKKYCRYERKHTDHAEIKS